MHIDVSTLPARDAYQLMIACLIPRPIAWVSTVDQGKRTNLAPFSFFGGVTSSPPTVMVSVGRRDGERKDTARNLLATREAVVHIPHRALAEKMVASAAGLPPEESEFDATGLTTAPSVAVRAPRIADAAVAMEVVLRQHQEVGNGPVDLFLLEVLHVHLADDLLRDGLPDPALFQAVGRLGGASYCDTGAPFSVERPH